MNIKTTCLTETGTKALRQAIDENKQELTEKTFIERQTFKNTWKEIILEKPLTYILLLKNHSVLGSTYYITKKFSPTVNSAKEFNKDVSDEFDKMINEIQTAMEKNGATKDIDFIIEVSQ